MDASEFLVLVLDVLRHEFPDLSFSSTPTQPDVIPVHFPAGDTLDVGLYNIRASCSLPGVTRDDARQAIRRHFERLLAVRAAGATPPDWSAAQAMLRPILVGPRDDIQRIPLVLSPGPGQLAIGLVLDHPKVMQRVSQRLQQHWGVAPEQLYATALANLERATTQMPVETMGRPPYEVYAAMWKDSYDAARLLLPSVRERMVRAVGDPAYAAVPAWNMLLYWATELPPATQDRARAVVQAMYQHEPHPLTPEVFMVSDDGIQALAAPPRSSRPLRMV